MARIIYSSLVTSINGSAGGTTFQKNQYGNSMKNKPHMLTPRTQFQNQSKVFFQQCTREWRVMTNPERQSWINYANAYPMPTRLNPDAYLNAFNYFTKFNILRLLANQSFIRNVSLTQYNNSIADIYLSWDGVQFTFAFTFSSYSYTYHVLIFISPRIQGYTNPRTNRTRFIKSFNTNPDVSATEIGTAYQARLGSPLILGQSYYVDATWINQASGQIVEWPTSVITVIDES